MIDPPRSLNGDTRLHQRRNQVSQSQGAMQHRFVDEVERLSARPVLAFISNSHFGPDLEIELFMLGPARTE